MIKKTLSWVLAATTAVLMGLAGPALATTKWTPAACATGSFDPVTVDRGHYFLTSHMSMCEAPRSGPAYEIVLFLPGAIPMAYGSDLQSYLQADVSSEVILRGTWPTFAVCLLRAVDSRTACVRVDTAPDGTAASTPITLDDPLVLETVSFYETKLERYANPYCASCVTLYD